MTHDRGGTHAPGKRKVARRISAILAIAAGIFGLTAGSASAGLLYYTSTPAPTDSISYSAAGGEQNLITLQVSGGEYLFSEAGPSGIEGFPDFCHRVAGTSPNAVLCAMQVSPGRPITGFGFQLSDQDDFVNARTSLPTRIDGGAGSDIIKGGGGPDIINGDGSFAGVDGNDTIEGRGGPDSIYGAGGIDTVTYANTTPSVFVSLDGVANDGSGGEGDNVDPTVENIVGSKSSDQLTGSGLANVLTGGLGGDQLDGLSGNDRLIGGDGNDVLSGGLDTDRLQGGDGVDGGIGGPGADFISGGDGTDDYVDYSAVTAPLVVTVPDGNNNDGAAGERDNVQPDNEVLFGGSGDDQLSGTDNGGQVWGRGGNDQLFGGDNDDLLEGEQGNDVLEGGFRGDAMNGGSGTDTVDYGWHWYDDGFDVVGVSSTPDGAADDGNASLDQGTAGTDNVGADVEDVLGSGGPDYIEGTAGANRLRGAGHNDQLLGMGGADLLEGGTQADLLQGGGQADSLLGGDDNDTLDGGNGSDTLNGEAGDDTITYAGRAAAVAVILDGRRNDGADPGGNGGSSLAEEGDQDLAVENATGGNGDDVLKAQLAGVISILMGGSGNDNLNARDNDAAFAETDSLLCGLGSDRFAKDPADTQDSCEIALP